MPKVSVIIPVYNAAHYISECIESVLKQTLHDIEILIINDGSTDDSKTIIEEYQKKDVRIQLINQKNQGVSVARNKGLEVAKGEYIGFVDADDYIEVDLYKNLYNIAKKNSLDVVISNFIEEKNKIKIKRKPYFTTDIVYNTKYIKDNIIPFFIREDGLNSCCNKLYCSDFIHSNKFSFPINIANGEDALFNLQVFNKAKKVFFTDYGGYHYREVKGSATRSIVSKDYFKIALNVYQSKYNFQLPLSNKEINKLKSIRFINTVVSLIHVFFKPNKELSLIKRYQYVKRMINDSHVQKAIKTDITNLKRDKSYYYKFILTCIKFKSTIGLLLATKYSNFRNN